ncbi:UDP-N-acetylglucosamine--N-acetylmuramyl-(pentapeptide) pyrophosphoryl-undecaprenol N-acetylglucosamine transferase [bacterium BMS3Bbin10]|nr:UDP-N-acetylglucosamine--N-acetylmuramyl-(pentapeptide) pyrophosphoryl-undecaprenol N-acetylglucosamine transferase [bacterium BMS3Bbin10]
MSKPLVMIAAGGTGGHLFPAFALAEELKRRGFEVDLVTDVRADQYGIGFPGRSVHRVPSATLRGRTPLGVLKLALTLAWGIWRARALLKETNPAVIAGFGGYPTVPPLLAARLAGIPSVIHDANAVMGRANRLLARFASVIALTFEKTKYLRAGDRSKTRMVGMPVRDAVLEEVTPYRTRSRADAFSLLVFGGSQGARIFADVVPAALAGLPQAYRARLKLVQQVREEDMQRVLAAYTQAGIDAELATFFSDLPRRMANAHLVIGRSGASTVAELTVLGRPAILVPLPHALDNDQLENATRLQEVGGAWCIEQADFTPERLRNEFMHLADSPDAMKEAAKAALSLGEPQAVARLADVIEELARA